MLIPAFNPDQSLSVLLFKIRSLLQTSATASEHCFVIINDGSTLDSSLAVLKQVERMTDTVVINLPHNQGRERLPLKKGSVI